MKIQINSLEALERLIGGDNELEIEIRNSVVEEFSKKHLKSIANSEKLSNIYEAISKKLTSDFVERVNYTDGWTLTKKGEEAVKGRIAHQRERLIDGLVAEGLKSNKVMLDFETMLKGRADYIVSQLTDKNISSRLDKMVDDRLKQKLGL